jgi:hypothetical protein
MADEQNVQTQDIQNQNVAVTLVDDLAVATSIQTDIAKIEAAMENLVIAGETLFADEIAALKQKRDVLLAKAKAEEQAVTSELIVVEETFVRKYGQAAAHLFEIAMLAAILARLFGAV